MAECIHGFEAGMCDICFPRATPEPAAAVRAAAPRVRVASTRPPTRSLRPSASAPSGPTLPAFGSRRLYHVTHQRNLESILLDGAIRSIADGAEPDLDVAARIVRDLRARADVGDGRTVDRFVPLALTPDADRWVELREGAVGAHWSAAARLTGATEYVMLVVSAAKLGSDVVVANGDASAPATRFSIGEPTRAVSRAATVDPELVAAEVLVEGSIPLEAVVLVGVPNEPARSKVRAMFQAVETTAPRIVVHTPWFTPVA